MTWHRRAVLSTVRFLFDWRTGLTVLASLLVALVLVVVVTGARTTQNALDARQRTAVAATRRIDRLNDRIEELGAELVVAAYSNGQRLGELSDQVAALQEQVRQLGGDPVIVNDPATTTTRPRQTATTTSTTTTTKPLSTTTTTTPCRLTVAGRCIGGHP